MTSTVSIFAGPDDYHELLKAVEQLGLTPLPMRLDVKLPDNPKDGPYTYLTFLPVERLHPYGSPPSIISDVTDPLLDFIRPYYSPPDLVAGSIRWNDDAPEFAAQARPYFNRIKRWIVSHWRRRKEDGYYIGPEADQLAREGLARLLYLPPDLQIETRQVGGSESEHDN